MKKNIVSYGKIITKCHSFLIVVVLVFVVQSLYPQCKLNIIKDDFDSSKSASSKEVTIASVFPVIGSKKPWDLVMNFMLIDGSVLISVTHQSQKYSSSISSIIFKFTDGTVLNKEKPNAITDYNTGLGYVYKSTGFLLTKEELELFASKDLLKFRAIFKYFPDYPVVEENIKSKSVEKIRKDAACMLDEFNLASNTKKENKKEINDVTEYNCSYEMDKIDGFTKKRNVLTKAALLYDKKVDGGQCFFQVSGCNNNGVNGLKVDYCLNVIGIAQIEENLKAIMLFDQVEILLENDEPISLKTDAVSEFLLQSQVNTAWSFKLFTNENDSIWQKLKAIPLKTLRLSMKGKELWTQEIEKKYSKSLINVINCVDALGIPKAKTSIGK